ncbi:MAG: DUF4252 domain-containing protein [Flavobacteriia bacterium]|nr:DUF4252 domain-containing protein [Flavobacteriia bacterium]OIP48797.1 MAG: hypothetical protein AUK46_00560 [Flavobacteriaceae bacterium CG2_30_31_66]PIV95517.1 MAG: DUF4252 domain-containing protein [Flavobacteriaceae bacterium CG17_big_fil_post_rev_8_21_14_2_50_31_13]PIX14438.1 MAG: DUF4252 domain-containing protein [Flavobacteriaceae bacterium CG_4_8_14_3_um_filter_31_8]PIY14226.1 MAG: DUF4252 domain-containing protein [Flavobacteriaceae bacterium CG_4_10_14_3_um_filter_31_253]PIZ10335.
MKKTSILKAMLLLVFLATSCKNEKSLQKYLVETSGKEGFITGDIPVSSLISAKADVSEEIKETIKSVQKINVAFLQKTTENQALYETEKNTLKNIFTNNNYKSLGKMKAQGMNVTLYFTGETDAIDEIIAFGYSNEVGVGVARLLGKNMSPAKMLEMMNYINVNQESMKDFGNIFSK